ncbi:hypothetical protein ACFWTE_21250 [Nocardiopsis sp. NPDC058631]|uniref:hypothetical protein n=1 Tax=Nocardiopsis sp. NPDC058631 TaxID=3346566 RepID=UPI00364A3AF8
MRGSKRERTTGAAGERTTRPTASPRSPVEVLDDLIARRRHPTSDPSDSADPGLAWEHHRPTDEQLLRHGRIRGFQRQGGSLAPTNEHRGRAVSWVAVVLACTGFALGGLGVALGMSVILLAVGGLLLAVAAVVAVRYDLLSDVVLDSPRVEPEEPHDTPLRRLRKDHSVTS